MSPCLCRDNWFDILSFLDVRETCRVKEVSREWLSLIDRLLDEREPSIIFVVDDSKTSSLYKSVIDNDDVFLADWHEFDYYHGYIPRVFKRLSIVKSLDQDCTQRILRLIPTSIESIAIDSCSVYETDLFSLKCPFIKELVLLNTLILNTTSIIPPTFFSQLDKLFIMNSQTKWTEFTSSPNLKHFVCGQNEERSIDFIQDSKNIQSLSFKSIDECNFVLFNSKIMPKLGCLWIECKKLSCHGDFSNLLKKITITGTRLSIDSLLNILHTAPNLCQLVLIKNIIKQEREATLDEITEMSSIDQPMINSYFQSNTTENKSNPNLKEIVMDQCEMSDLCLSILFSSRIVEGVKKLRIYSLIIQKRGRETDYGGNVIIRVLHSSRLFSLNYLEIEAHSPSYSEVPLSWGDHSEVHLLAHCENMPHLKILSTNLLDNIYKWTFFASKISSLERVNILEIITRLDKNSRSLKEMRLAMPRIKILDRYGH